MREALRYCSIVLMVCSSYLVDSLSYLLFVSEIIVHQIFKLRLILKIYIRANFVSGVKSAKNYMYT